MVICCSILGLSSLIYRMGPQSFPCYPSELDMAGTVLWELFCGLMRMGGAMSILLCVRRKQAAKTLRRKSSWSGGHSPRPGHRASRYMAAVTGWGVS